MTKPEDPISWLFERQRLGMTLGLERMKGLLQAAGEPHRHFRSVLIAGTNGKGSTARALAECLTASEATTGLFTSPHLSRVGERFLIDGREPARDEIAATVEELRTPAEESGASFFEIVTATACLLFRRAGVEVAVMEVGLGGRFDATNALEPELGIITGIALDHQEILGDDIGSIAREKAGIFRDGVPALTGATGEALAVLRGEATRIGAGLWEIGRELRVSGETRGWQGVSVEIDSPLGTVSALSPLVGMHQVRNLALAAVGAQLLGVPERVIERGLATARWPGRLERIAYRGRWLVLDGAHNPEAAAALAATLEMLEGQPFTLLIGVGREKDLAGIAQVLGSRASRVVATRAGFSPRARPAAEVASAFGAGAEAVADPQAALAAAVAATPEEGTVVVAGSLYLIGELRPVLTGESFEPAERWQ